MADVRPCTHTGTRLAKTIPLVEIHHYRLTTRALGAGSTISTTAVINNGEIGKVQRRIHFRATR